MSDKKRKSYAALQQIIVDNLPRTYGRTIARMYWQGWLEGSLCAVGRMPRFGSTRLNVTAAFYHDEDIEYITKRAKLDWDKRKYGQLSFDLLKLRQWLSLEETSSLIFYKQRAEVTEARKWKSLLKNHRSNKRKK